MCRYADPSYRDTYVCLDCRVSWHGPSWRPTWNGKSFFGSIHCGRCGSEGVNIGKDYKVPRRTQVNQWKKLAILIASGQNFQTCGCNGLGKLPKTYSDAKNMTHKASRGDLVRNPRKKPSRWEREPVIGIQWYA